MLMEQSRAYFCHLNTREECIVWAVIIKRKEVLSEYRYNIEYYLNTVQYNRSSITEDNLFNDRREATKSLMKYFSRLIRENRKNKKYYENRIFELI